MIKTMLHYSSDYIYHFIRDFLLMNMK